MGYRKLGRTSSQRKAMLRNLATDVIISGRIETTVTRAKETQKLVDKLITLGKRGEKNIHAIRQAKALLFNAVDENNTLALKKLFSEIAPGYAERQGGYTRVLKLGPRRGDGSEMAIIELV